MDAAKYLRGKEDDLADLDARISDMEREVRLEREKRARLAEEIRALREAT